MYHTGKLLEEGNIPSLPWNSILLQNTNEISVHHAKQHQKGSGTEAIARNSYSTREFKVIRGKGTLPLKTYMLSKSQAQIYWKRSFTLYGHPLFMVKQSRRLTASSPRSF